MAHPGLKDTEEAAAAVEKDRAEHTSGSAWGTCGFPFWGFLMGISLQTSPEPPTVVGRILYDLAQFFQPRPLRKRIWIFCLRVRAFLYKNSSENSLAIPVWKHPCQVCLHTAVTS